MKLVLTALSTLLVILLIAGCSDDDCADCPSMEVPAGVVSGTINVSPGAVLNAQITSLGSFSPSLDSIWLGDSLLTFDDHFAPYGSEPPIIIWEIQYNDEVGPDYMYAHGDTAHVVFFGDGRTATCNVVVLNPNEAVLNIIDYEPDVIAPGEPLVVHWNRVPLVPYYGVVMGLYNVDNGIVSYPSFRFEWTADTVFTVQPQWYPDSLLYMWFAVVPFTGPNPDSWGNVTGGWLTGRITSSGIFDGLEISGWAESGPVAKAYPRYGDLLRQWTPAEIVDRIYQQAAK